MKPHMLTKKLLNRWIAAFPRPDKGGAEGSKASSPRPAMGGDTIAEPPSPPSQHGGGPHEDLERAARGFVEENTTLVDEPGASADVLRRVYDQGCNLYTTATPESVAVAHRARDAKHRLADAIRDPSTPAQELRGLEEEERLASEANRALYRAFTDLSDLLDRAKARLG